MLTTKIYQRKKIRNPEGSQKSVVRLNGKDKKKKKEKKFNLTMRSLKFQNSKY